MISARDTRETAGPVGTHVSERTLVVVGDRFEAFLRNRGVIAASGLLARCRAGDLPRGTSIVVGQGLSTEQLEELDARVRDGRGAIATAGAVPVRADRRLTHKRDRKNVMISRPRRVEGDRFEVDLVVDERNEVLEDHITGQHIPAVALIEAARQTWTAVTEEFHLERDAGARFVVTSITSSFERYVLPLPATLGYDLLSRERTAAGEAFACRVTVRQGGAVSAQIEGRYRTIWERLCAKQEAIAARQAVAGALAVPGAERLAGQAAVS